MLKFRQTVNQLILTPKSKFLFSAICFFSILIFSIDAASADTIFEALDNGKSTIVDTITDAYCNNIFPFLLVAVFIWVALAAHNQKMLSAAMTSLFVICGVFLGLKLLNVLINTLQWVADTLGSGAGTSSP